jgi:hypothetical protein
VAGAAMLETPERRRGTMNLKPRKRSRMSRMAWSLFRHPLKTREFPAKNERLITADELIRFGF